MAPKGLLRPSPPKALRRTALQQPPKGLLRPSPPKALQRPSKGLLLPMAPTIPKNTRPADGRRTAVSGAGGQLTILTRAVSASKKPKPPSEKTSYVLDSLQIIIPKDSLGVLIGLGGRNICLIAKYAHVLVQATDWGNVQILSKGDHSEPLLAKQMITSIISGGVIRWFTHPSNTQRYYPLSVRAELQALTCTMTKNHCTLQLLRAHSGHLCLFVMPISDAFEPSLMKELRPVILARITELGSEA